ncbi:MAG: choice-of-anchor D domain-containing protein [Planctomycetes bacterium]|nr:choice-of-anchor D domain-containing protein [Planctomycetota bacterium]
MKNSAYVYVVLSILFIFTPACNVLINPVPEINIQDSSETDIINGTGIFDFGNLWANYEITETFTIQNTGHADLELTGSPRIVITGIGESVFSVTLQPTSPIMQGNSTTFKISFNPTNAGNKIALVSIANNDLEENPFTFTVTGKGYETSFDFNGDGYDDVIVGAYRDDDGGRYSGCAFIFFGSSNPSSVIDTSKADVKLIGGDVIDFFGRSVSNAGDVNKDGYDDVIVGADYDDDGGSCSGCAFIFFGSSNPSSIIDSSKADVKLIGEDSGSRFGTSVSGAGDVNGDGFDDVIVGAHYDNDSGRISGCAFIFYGRYKYNWPSVVDASNANVKLIGEDSSDGFGGSVSSAGDFNDDGYDDIIVGATGDDEGGQNSGSAFIFFGSSNMYRIIHASNADVKLIGDDSGDRFGWSVSCAGDVNGDGYKDVIFGAHSDDDGGRQSGCAFIFFGRINLSSVIDASNTNVKLIGEDEYDCFGCSVSGGK